jgi:hypothetical protein
MMSAASIMRVWRSRAAAPLRRGHELAGAALAAVLLAAPAVSTAAGADAGAPAVGSASSAAQFIVHFAPASRPPSGAQIGEATRADLQRLLGRPIIVGEPTRAGDQVIRLTGTATRAEANQLVNRLRMRTDISWAELDPSLQVAVPRSTGSRAAAPLVKRRVRRLIVTFEDEQSLQEARRNGKLGPERDAALSAAAGSLLRVSRATVGGAWLVEGLASMDIAAAEALAARLEASGAVRYAAPDYPAAPALVPNDSYFAAGQQWNLGAPAPPNSFGIGAPQAWNITTGSASVVVAVVDTGIVAHPDLTRILPGYDFISDPFRPTPATGAPRANVRRPSTTPPTAAGTERSSRGSSPRTATTARASPASTGTRRSCRCARSVAAADPFPTSSMR